MAARDVMGSPTAARAVARGLLRRCPVCGSRGTFESWYVRRERCPKCAFPTMRVTDQWIGAYGMNVIVSFTILVATIAAGFAVTYPDPPVASLLVLCTSVAIGFPVVFQPISWSLWSGIDVAMRPPEGTELDVRAWDPAAEEGHEDSTSGGATTGQ